MSLFNLILAKFSLIKVRRRSGVSPTVRWSYPVQVVKPSRLKIGEGSFVGEGVKFDATGGICIGKEVLISASVFVTSRQHRFEDIDNPIKEQGYSCNPVLIEDDVWLGNGAKVMPGVTIGKGAVIGAGAVVTKNIPSYEVWCGVPARFLKKRGE